MYVLNLHCGVSPQLTLVKQRLCLQEICYLVPRNPSKVEWRRQLRLIIQIVVDQAIRVHFRCAYYLRREIESTRSWIRRLWWPAYVWPFPLATHHSRESRCIWWWCLSGRQEAQLTTTIKMDDRMTKKQVTNHSFPPRIIHECEVKSPYKDSQDKCTLRLAPHSISAPSFKTTPLPSAPGLFADFKATRLVMACTIAPKLGHVFVQFRRPGGLPNHDSHQ